MAEIKFNRDSIDWVRRWVECCKKDVTRDINDIQSDISAGVCNKYDAAELDRLSGVLVLLRSFEAVLAGVQKGGAD